MCGNVFMATAFAAIAIVVSVTTNECDIAAYALTIIYGLLLAKSLLWGHHLHVQRLADWTDKVIEDDEVPRH